MLKQLLIGLAVFLPGTMLGEGMIAGAYVPPGAQEFDFFPRKGIRMEVAFDWEFKERTKESIDFNVVIYCRWTNTGDRELKLLLKDHDYYHGTLDYPWGLYVRVTEQGKEQALTKNSTIPDGWWSSSLVHAQISETMPGDAIVLLPRQSVSRQVPLQSVLSGLSYGFENTRLPTSGSFHVDVRLGEINASPKLSLSIKPPK
jgi:hypothetical protein